MHHIHPIKILEDNYVWSIQKSNSPYLVIVDPGEAEPVLEYINQHHLTLAAILLTHHHLDHTGGVTGILERYPNTPVYGSRKDEVPGMNYFIEEGDLIDLPKLDLNFKVMEIPGHTHGHVAYLHKNMLFSGDVLFSSGVGKIFEGTALQMFQSLEKLKQLPTDTLIYAAHEYTLANIVFAQTVDSKNEALERRRLSVEELRKNDLPSLPVSLETELQTNPFLRCDVPSIMTSVQSHCGIKLSSPLAIFTHLRLWKDKFKHCKSTN